ncbi:unnamed protein product [Mytilus coruscus]|uniref:Retrotransposon gag domain-containing protein n=1 Tax=Mytilus coruscus TaxID=42192 RepID=A0A6J8AAI0_MYTCO|nr:unnamed protein product [Mytilus coruscus]
MDDSLQSDIIQFNPTDRSSIASDDTVVNNTHEMRTSSQNSYESIQAAHQSNGSPAISPSVGDIFESLTNQIRDTFHMVTQENAANLSMMEDRFENSFGGTNIQEEFNKQKIKSDQIQSEKSEIIVPEVEIIKTHAVQEPKPLQNSACIPSNSETSSYQNTRGIQSHPSYYAGVTQKHKVNMKPQPYDGTDDIEEYLGQFQILAEVNGWDYNTMSLCLANSLKGGARAILNELNEFKRRDFDSLVDALHNRFGSVHRSEIFRAQLQTRVRKDNESLSALSQDIKKMTRCAYPGAPSSVTDILALDQFIDALHDPEMRLRIREARPKNINEAEILAIRFDTFNQADRIRYHSLTNAVAGMSVESKNKCFRCGEKDTSEKFVLIENNSINIVFV